MRERLVLSLLVALIGGAVSSPANAQHVDWRDSVRALDGPIKALTDSMIHGDSNAAEVLRSGDLVLGASPALRTAAIAALGKLARARAAWFGDQVCAKCEFAYGSANLALGHRDQVVEHPL